MKICIIKLRNTSELFSTKIFSPEGYSGKDASSQTKRLSSSIAGLISLAFGSIKIQ